MKLTAEYLRERLDYDPETGALTWRPLPGVTKEQRRWNTRHAGAPAGSVTKRGYVRFRVGAVKQVFGHQVVWCLETGEWPEFEIDHRDRNKENNRFGNLRPADTTLNRANSSLAKNNTSGRKGVTWHKRVRKWAVQTSFRGEAIHIGYFVDKEEAARAYMRAAKKHFGEFATDGA